MYEDVSSSIMLDKQMLIELVNENVISFSHPRILKTPTVAILLGFFLFSFEDVELDVC
jgi:hypothetical protein|tara:strand:- start:154 stop:327 length:174 start_codon:yes stop_codon:yes gene_type:complete